MITSTSKERFARWLALGVETGPLVLGAEPQTSDALVELLSAETYGPVEVIKALWLYARQRSGQSKTIPIAFAACTSVAPRGLLIKDYALALLSSDGALFRFCHCLTEEGLWGSTSRNLISHWYTRTDLSNIVFARPALGWNHRRVIDFVAPKVEGTRGWLVDWVLGQADPASPQANQQALATTRVCEPMRSKLRARLVEHYGIPLRLLPEQKLRSDKFWQELDCNCLSLDEILMYLDRIVGAGKDLTGNKYIEATSMIKIVAAWQRADEALRPEVEKFLPASGRNDGSASGRTQLVLGKYQEQSLALLYWARAQFGRVTVRRAGGLEKFYLPRPPSLSAWSTALEGLKEDEVDLERLVSKMKGAAVEATLVASDHVVGNYRSALGKLIVLRSAEGASVPRAALEIIGKFGSEAADAIEASMREKWN